MKAVKCIVMFIGVIAAFTIELKAQSIGDKNNNMDPNANYKDQIPVNKGNKFKDSFKNDRMEDLSADNYKQQQPKKKSKKNSARQNFNTSKRTNNSSSKHPYGL